MSTDRNALTDEVRVELMATAELPERPAEKAPRGKWVDYCVALGASRHYLENETQHFVATAAGDGGEYECHPPLTRPDLIKLADSLGG